MRSGNPSFFDVTVGFTRSTHSTLRVPPNMDNLFGTKLFLGNWCRKAKNIIPCYFRNGAKHVSRTPKKYNGLGISNFCTRTKACIN